MFVLSIICNK